LQAGGQTGLVACASIAPFPFTQLIQQPGAEQSIDPYPSARGAEHRDQDTHRVARLKWQGATNIHGPRTCSIIQPTLLYLVLTKTLGGFAMSLSLFIADHHLSGGVFLSLFTNHNANPTCMEEARCCILGLGSPLGLSSKPNHMLSQDPFPQCSRSCEMIMSLADALEREMSSHIRPDQLSDLLLSMRDLFWNQTLTRTIF
jgi:hypothetical protein